ncbi:hypothetical protein SAVCW2_74690 [Streptomyces avermitilis]|nr:hypothetical protein SAVCW2_74690 [Streptomyces avermitilis]
MQWGAPRSKPALEKIRVPRDRTGLDRAGPGRAGQATLGKPSCAKRPDAKGPSLRQIGRVLNVEWTRDQVASRSFTSSTRQVGRNPSASAHPSRRLRVYLSINCRDKGDSPSTHDRAPECFPMLPLRPGTGARGSW